MSTVVGPNHTELGPSGNYLCENGVGVEALTGAGSYAQTNSNYVWQIVNSNFALASAGASETVSLSINVNASSSCMATPANSTSAAIAAALPVIATGTNVGTMYHPTGIAGTRWNLSCAPGPYN